MKVLHAADFHLDSPFHAASPEEAALFRREQREILFSMVAVAKERVVELVLISGDVFDSSFVYEDTIEALEEALRQMPCPVLIAPGNHDPYGPNSPYHRVKLPNHVYLFRKQEMEAVKVGEAIIYGCAFTESYRTDSPLKDFSIIRDGKLHLMVLHGDLNGGPYAPIKKEEIKASGLTYLALGHVHTYSGLQREGTTYYAYPGCPQGRGRDETGEKGALLLSITEAGVSSEFLPLGRRIYEMPSKVDSCPKQVTTEDVWERVGEDSLAGLFLQKLRERYEETTEEEQKKEILLAAKLGLAALEQRELPF